MHFARAEPLFVLNVLLWLRQKLSQGRIFLPPFSSKIKLPLQPNTMDSLTFFTEFEIVTTLVMVSHTKDSKSHDVIQSGFFGSHSKLFIWWRVRFWLFPKCCPIILHIFLIFRRVCFLHACLTKKTCYFVKREIRNNCSSVATKRVKYQSCGHL